MSFLDKVREIFVAPDDEYEEEEQEEMMMDAEEEEADEQPSASHFRKPRYEYSDPTNAPARNKVVSMRADNQLKMILLKPSHIDEARSIADHLNERRTVVLNMEEADNTLIRRMLDFLSGVAYANNGKIQRVSDKTWVATPSNVDMTGDLLGELENSGVYME